MKFPYIVREQRFIEVLLDASQSVSKLPIEFVLDFDRFGEVIGIEILDLKASAGNRCLQIVAQSGMHYSYDASSDAFFLRLTEDMSLDQKAVLGELLVNNEQQIVGFRASFRGTNVNAI